MAANAIDKDGWLHTGDKGTTYEESYLLITGRIKEIIVTSTRRISHRYS